MIGYCVARGFAGRRYIPALPPPAVHPSFALRAPRRVEVSMHPDLFWAIVLAGCLIALAFIAIPNDAGVLKDHEGDPAPRKLRARFVRNRWDQER